MKCKIGLELNSKDSITVSRVEILLVHTAQDNLILETRAQPTRMVIPGLHDMSQQWIVLANCSNKLNFSIYYHISLQAYSKQFISKISHKHTLARVHFAKLPGMAEALRMKTTGSKKMPGVGAVEGVSAY